MKYFGAPYPIERHPLGFLHTEEGLNQIKADLLILLLTNPGERVMLSNFGTPLRKLFFEQNDTMTENRARQMISDAIRIWEPRITVKDIEVTSQIDESKLDFEDTKDEKDHILAIRITFFDPKDISELKELVLQIPESTLG
jgi:phage baseplate assembly protein W